MNVKEVLEDYAGITEDALERYLPEVECMQKSVISAARYSLKAGGKRLRPALVMEFCRVCGEEPETALPVACAIEMMHTFSLIHDDLPCMDNDDLRRGKSSCHKEFGEATAMLAGDALAMLPFQIISEAALKKLIPQDTALKIIKLLGENAGVFGMIGGQTLDLEFEKKTPDTAAILQMYRMKTGALLEFCCKIVDDILDITADEKLLGKPVGSDAAEGKHTYVSAVGLERAREEATDLTIQAKEFLKEFSDNEFLMGLTDMLLERHM